MKNISQISLYFLMFLLIEGCSHNSNKYYNPQEFYSLKDTLKGEILSNPIQSSGSVRLYYNEYGLLACTKLDHNMFQLLDSTTAKRITATGQRGRGPNEFLSAQGMQYDYATNQFSVFDMYTQELATYLVSPDSISLTKRVNMKMDLQSVKYITDSLLAFINFYPGQKIGLINTNAEVIYEEEYNPLDDERIKTMNGYHSVKLDISPNKEYTVAIDGRFSFIRVYRNKPDKIELIWKKTLFEPKYTFNSKDNWYVLDDKNYMGFRSLYLTNQYIYLSCDDMTFLDLKRETPSYHTYLLVMDYEGTIVKKYLMDKFFAPFTISPDEKSLYAVIYDPDMLIAKYTL